MVTNDYRAETNTEDGAWIRWGPTFAGAVSAIALTTMGMALWLAIGYGSGVGFFRDNMQWFFLGTALAGLIAGGVIAGASAARRGLAVGFVDGLLVWGLVAVAALIPLSLRALALANSGANAPATRTALGVSSGNLWALFGVLVGGLFCAVGGALVAAMPGRRVHSQYVRTPDEAMRPTRPSERRVS